MQKLSPQLLRRIIIDGCFVDVCLAPVDSTDDNVEYKFYKGHHHGSLNPHPIFADMNHEDETGNLGMAIGTLDGRLRLPLAIRLNLPKKVMMMILILIPTIVTQSK